MEKRKAVHVLQRLARRIVATSFVYRVVLERFEKRYDEESGTKTDGPT